MASHLTHVGFRLDHQSRAALAAVLQLSGRSESDYARTALRKALLADLKAIATELGKTLPEGVTVGIEDAGVNFISGTPQQR